MSKTERYSGKPPTALEVEIASLRTANTALTRERDEAVAREAVIKAAFETVTEKEGIIHSTLAWLNLEGAIIDLERFKTADRVIIGTMKRVARQLGQIESALATPSPRVEALLKVVERALKYCDESMDNENVNDSFDDLYEACDALRAQLATHDSECEVAELRSLALPRTAALLAVVEAAVDYVHNTCDATFDALEDHIRALDTGELNGWLAAIGRFRSCSSTS